MLLTDLQSPLSEHSTSGISMFFVMSCFKGRLVKSFISLNTWLTGVIFCLSGGFLTGFMKALNAFRASVLAGKRIRWPNHANLLLCMVIFHGFILVCAFRSLLQIVLGHLSLMILLSSFFWNTYMLFSSFCVNVHSSELHMKILWMYVANTLILTFSLTCLLLKMDSNAFWYLFRCGVVIQDICIFSKHLLQKWYLYVIPFRFAFIYMQAFCEQHGCYLPFNLIDFDSSDLRKYHQHTLGRYWSCVHLNGWSSQGLTREACESQ